jgi:hypothetical protein
MQLTGLGFELPIGVRMQVVAAMLCATNSCMGAFADGHYSRACARMPTMLEALRANDR